MQQIRKLVTRVSKRAKRSSKWQSKCVNPLFLAASPMVAALTHSSTELSLTAAGGTGPGRPWRHREESDSAPTWCGGGPCALCAMAGGKACAGMWHVLGALCSTWNEYKAAEGFKSPLNCILKHGFAKRARQTKVFSAEEMTHTKAKK